MKIFFFHKTKSRDSRKLKCKNKGCQTKLLYEFLQKFNFRDRIRDLRETIFESTFYLQFFASLTSDSLANLGVITFKRNAAKGWQMQSKKDNTNFKSVQFSVVSNILSQKLIRFKT